MSNSQPAEVQTAPRPAGLLRSSLVVGMMTMLSRVLGLIRDMVIAHYVGASAAADAFFVAFRIPNFMRRLFAEGAFSQAFVPVLSEYREQRSLEAVKALVDRVAGALGGSLLLVTGLAVVGAPVVALVFAPGFYLADDPIRYQLTSAMVRVTFPYLFLISMAGFCGAVLNSYGRFAVPAFTPALLNVSLITAATVVSPYFHQPGFALAWGVLAAGLLQFTFQLPFMHGLTLMPRPRWDWQHEGVKRILKLMGPAIFGVSVSQINLLLDTVLASFLPTGSVSWLYYSDRLVELPLGVFAIAISTVILPSLSRQQANNSPEAFRATLDWALRMVPLIAIPAAVALFILAKPILVTLFQHGGKLTLRDIDMASFSLRAYTIGLLAFMLIKVLAPGYYSRQDTRTPVRFGIVAMVSNMVMNIAFVVPLNMYWRIGHAGLALATSLAAYINAGLLYRGLRRRQVYSPMPGFTASLLRILAAAATMGVLIALLAPPVEVWSRWHWWQQGLNLLWLCGAGVATYVVALLIVGARPRHFLAHATTRS